MARQNLTPSTAAYVARVADATGVSATDNAAIQAAHDNMPAAGGAIVLGFGDYAITGLTFSKPVALSGRGSGDVSVAAATRLVVSADATTAITATANGCTFTDLGVVNTLVGTPTSGAGIHFTAGDLAHLTRVTVSGFYNNVEFANGSYWTMSDSLILDPVNYGVLIRCTNGGGDWGDQKISGCLFMVRNKNYTPAAAIRYESGGGLKVLGSKIVSGFTDAYRFAVGLDLAVADGVSTGDLLITGSSVEGCTTAQVRLGLAGTTGAFSNIVITGNEFGDRGWGIQITGKSGASQDFNTLEITGNVFAFLPSGSITANNCNGLHIGPNTHNPPVSGAGQLGPYVVLGNSVLRGQMDRQHYNTYNLTNAVAFTSSMAPGNGGYPDMAMRYEKDFLLATNGVYQTAVSFKAFSANTTGGRVRVTASANGIVRVAERVWACNQNILNVQVATIGSDLELQAGGTTGGTNLPIQFNATTNYQLDVQVAPGSAGMVGSYCHITVEIFGQVASVLNV